jgi:hypothetical protein
MRAAAFVLSDLLTGRGLAYALICPEARYCSIAWFGADRLDRRFVPIGDWRSVEARIVEGLPAGPLEASHAIVRALLAPEDRTARIVQYLSVQDIDAAPATVAATLDAWLRGIASPPDT